MRVLKTHLKPLGVRYTNRESLRPPNEATVEEWQEVRKTAESLIDDSPEDDPKKIMLDILDHIADSLRLDITPQNIRNMFGNNGDWLRYLRTYMPLTEIEQIRKEVVELTQNLQDGEPPWEDLMI